MRATIVTAFILLLIGSAAAAPAAKPGIKSGAKSPPPANATKLAPDNIKATFFNGQAFTAATPAGIKYKMLFTADGKVTREPVGKAGVKGDGTWSLSKDGFCTTWKNSKQNCYKLFAKGENNWAVSNGSATLATWSK